MATLAPPRSAKRVRLAEAAESARADELLQAGKIGPSSSTLIVQFRNGQDGSLLGPVISLPAATGASGMNMIVNQLRKEVKAEMRRNRTREEKEAADSEDEDEDDLPFGFHVALNEDSDDKENGVVKSKSRLTVSKSLKDDVLNAKEAIQMGMSEEDVLQVVFEPQAVFKVRPVRRCSSTLSGHSSPILCSVFSPSGALLLTGSGDNTARLWDLTSETPLHTLCGHTGWVLCAEWEGRERRVATGDMNGEVRIWDALDSTSGKTGRLAWGSKTGDQVQQEREDQDDGKLTSAQMRALRHASPKSHVLKGHTKWITSLAWEPIHLNASSPRLASSSKDGTVRVWNTATRMCQYALGGHTSSVNVVRWGGRGLLYTASSDRSVKVWDAKDGKLIRTLSDHAHWVNTLSLSTDFVLRTGPFDHYGKYLDVKDAEAAGKDEAWRDAKAKEAATKRYMTAIASGNRAEQVISGSDDHTLYLWPPQSHLDSTPTSTPKKPLARLTGHQKLINHVTFSPDGNLIASASFDNSVKLWNGRDGKFIATLRGHVSCVYRIAWSADSRLLISASKDSTLKLWDLRTFKIKMDLPGHSDEVYCVDFAADKVASGGRDKVLKIWRN